MRSVCGPEKLSVRASRALFVASTMLTLAGCVSATGELQAVSTQAELASATRKEQVKVAQPATTNAIDPAAAQTADAAQIPVLQPDQLYPVATAVAIDPTIDAQQAADAVQPGSLVAQPGTISATTNSIYAAPSTLNAQMAALEAGQQQQIPVDPDASGLPVMVPVPSVNPLKASLFEAPVTATTETAALDPVTPAPVVADTQPAEISGQQALVTAMVEPAVNGIEAFPGQLAAQIPLTRDHEEGEDGQPGDSDAKTRSLGAIDSDVDPMPSMNDLSGKPAKKKNFSLADLFKRKKSNDEFNKDRFGKPKPGSVKVAAMPGLANPVVTDALPGVNANAMFPTANADESHVEETDDDEPAGLMKLASLPSITRQPMNGLWMQTDEVEVRCLRPDLVRMIKYVESHYKRPVIVTSGYRDRKHNRRVGGVRRSLHMLCAAADIQVEGVTKWQLAEYLRTIPGRGGVGTYCHTESVHIDIGSERDWNWRCRRKKKKHRS